MPTLILHKNTARDIAKARRAIAATDKEKALADTFGPGDRRRSRINHSPRFDASIATLRITGETALTFPIRCDILAKWTAAHENADLFKVVVDDTLAITVSPVITGGGARAVGSMRLLPAATEIEGEKPGDVDYIGALPIVARMAAEFGSCELVPDFDTKSACLTARTLRVAKAEAKAAGDRARELREEKRQRDEYRTAVALLTPANLAKAAKQLRSLRKLKRWARTVAPVMQRLPHFVAFEQNEYPQMNPLATPEFVERYAATYGTYVVAQKREQDYKPRRRTTYFYGGKSKTALKLADESARAADALRAAVRGALCEHLAEFGAHAYFYGDTPCVHHSGTTLASRVSIARKIARKYRAAIADAFTLA
jgi:hypothetical protein